MDLAVRLVEVQGGGHFGWSVGDGAVDVMKRCIDGVLPEIISSLQERPSFILGFSSQPSR